jgi:hypothetical protein
MGAEVAHNFEREWQNHRELLSEQLRGQIELGLEVRAVDYQRVLKQIPLLHDSFVELFEQRYDAIDPSRAERGAQNLASTGDPAFCTSGHYACPV